MSKPRRSGMRRAYLKKTSYSYDDKPDSNLKAAIGLGRDINPIVALPHRARVWLDKNRHTPTITEPMKERVESWRLAVKEQDRWYMIRLSSIDNPFDDYRMHYKGHTERAIYYFTHLNKLSGTMRTSFTLSKLTALKIRENGLKGIPWKEENT